MGIRSTKTSRQTRDVESHTLFHSFLFSRLFLLLRFSVANSLLFLLLTVCFYLLHPPSSVGIDSTGTMSNNDIVVCDDGSLQSINLRYNAYRETELSQADFVQDVVSRYNYVCEVLAHDRHNYDTQLKTTQDALDEARDKLGIISHRDSREAYVSVIIDGNDLLFDDTLVRDGDRGGRRASVWLHDAIKAHLASSQKVPDHTKIVVRLYCDVDTLVSLALVNKIVTSPGPVRAFFRGFCQDRVLCDVIDVGGFGRETIIDKVEGESGTTCMCAF